MSGPDTRDPTAAPDTPETRCAAYEAAMETGDTEARRRWVPRRTEARTEARTSDGVLKRLRTAANKPERARAREIGKWVLIVVLGWIAPWWLLGQIARWAWGY